MAHARKRLYYSSIMALSEQETIDQYKKDYTSTYYPILELVHDKSYSDAIETLTHCINLIQKQKESGNFNITSLKTP